MWTFAYVELREIAWLVSFFAAYMALVDAAGLVIGIV